MEAVAMDMWSSEEQATKNYCPNAEIVYDPFHVIQAYGRDVVDKVRVAEYRRASELERNVIKGSRYLLLKKKIEPLKVFALMLKEHLEGILAHCKYPIHTGVLEGLHNKVKVIKRIAYGFRDIDFFFLKIRGSFRPIHTLA